VIEPDLAPQLGPMIAIEALQRVDDALRVVAANAFERVDVAGAPHHLLLDLVERALLRARARRRHRQAGSDAGDNQAWRVHDGPPRALLRLGDDPRSAAAENRRAQMRSSNAWTGRSLLDFMMSCGEISEPALTAGGATGAVVASTVDFAHSINIAPASAD